MLFRSDLLGVTLPNDLSGRLALAKAGYADQLGQLGAGFGLVSSNFGGIEIYRGNLAGDSRILYINLHSAICTLDDEC